MKVLHRNKRDNYDGTNSLTSQVFVSPPTITLESLLPIPSFLIQSTEPIPSPSAIILKFPSSIVTSVPELEP